jgi:3-oxoacyl-[acyl-carrier protein] reductase
MTIFITGGSRGIGRNIVMMALERGWDVAFTYNNPATNVAEILGEAHALAPKRTCKAYQLDVRDPKQVEAVMMDVTDDFETIDAVVNNAGINQNKLAINMTDEDWMEVIQTNLSGSFYVIREFLPHMLANKKGRFISISSIAKDGLAGQANYASSKAGLIGLSCTIAKEYGSKGITSNVLVPGLFETDMTHQSLNEDLKKLWPVLCPLKRFGNLHELSELALFIASDASSYINGQVINVTGGMDWAP